jgi:hypothetical protein
VFDVVTVRVYNPSIKKLSVDQDAHVHGGGTNETTTFGRAQALVVFHQDPYSQFDRQAYLQFDTSTVDKSLVKSAVLNLPTSVQGAAAGAKVPVTAFATSSSWFEKTITFANKPAMSSSVGTGVVVQGASTTSIDVTGYVQSQGGGRLSFGLKQGSATAPGQINIRSHESGVGAELVVTYK